MQYLRKPNNSSSNRWMRQLASQVIKTQEEERRRVSRELHDEAGQALTVLKISLELILVDLSESQVDPSLCQRMKEAVHLCESTMAEIRLMAHDLRPAALDDLGLNLTLDGFCQDFAERTQLSVSYSGVELPVLADATKICLFRFLQEGLTNVAKHACATKIQVRLFHDSNTVGLVIEDNGKGIHPELSRNPANQLKGIGLLGIKERLASLGGYLEIVSAAGKGTRLIAVVPCLESG